MEQFIKSKLLKSDLVEIDRQIEDAGFNDIGSIVLVKQAFVSIANLVDFELRVRPMYVEHNAIRSIIIIQ